MMKYCSAVLLLSLCTTIYAHGFEMPLGTVYDSSLTCQNGATPKVICDTSTDESSCSCRCTNGINLERAFSYFLQGNGTVLPSSDNCEASKQQWEQDAKACTARGEDLINQLNACTFRERDSVNQAETCAVRERHSTEQLDACTARGNDLVGQLGACAAREKDTSIQLDTCVVRENDLLSQIKTLKDELEVYKQQVAAHTQTIASNAQEIGQLKTQVNTLQTKCIKFKYEGCYVDGASRVLSAYQKFGDVSMTTERCSSLCSNYKYFGTENAQECFCGDSLKASSVQGSQCNMVCKGNSGQMCGSGYRLSVYQHVL